MRIVIVAVGSWGDVRPNVLLGSALQNAGHEVLLIATEPFRQWVQERGLGFAGVHLDLQGPMAAVMDIDANFLGTLQGLWNAAKAMRPAVVQVGKEIAALVRERDTLLMNELCLDWLNGVVAKHRARLICTNMQPQVPTSQFPAMGMPSLPAWMPLRSTYHQLSYGLLRRMNWLSQGSLGNRLRTEHLALPKQAWARHQAMLDATPSLVLVSRHVLSPPADWPPQHHVTGYLFDEERGWRAPQALLDFLAAGEKPICIGFGSMAVRKPEAMMCLLLEAVRRTGTRAVVLSDWAGIGALALPKEVLLLNYAPHSWLFPRMAAVIHHGGAGTTAAGLRAGVPSVIVPFFMDQPFWARRVYELGVGTKPIPLRALSADRLAGAIQEATTNRVMQDKAAGLGKKIAVEDGIGQAMKAVTGILDCRVLGSRGCRRK